MRCADLLRPCEFHDRADSRQVGHMVDVAVTSLRENPICYKMDARIMEQAAMTG